MAMIPARNVVDSQHKPKEDYAHGIPVPERCFGLISATGSSPAPGIHVDAGSAAKGRWCLSGSHSSGSLRRRTRRVRWPGCFNHGTHKDWAASISSNRRCQCGFGRARWGGGNIASILAGCLPFVLEPGKTVHGSEIVNTVGTFQPNLDTPSRHVQVLCNTRIFTNF